MEGILVMTALLLGFAVAAPAIADDWSGPELGVEMGGAFGSDNGIIGCDPSTCAKFNYGVSTEGPFGGLHGGDNFLFNQFVIGGKADVDGLYL